MVELKALARQQTATKEQGAARLNEKRELNRTNRAKE